MSIIWAIIIGFIVGLVAKLLTPGRDAGGFFLTALLGIVGALVATFLGQAMGIYAAGQSAGFIASVIGAVIVLFVYTSSAGVAARCCKALVRAGQSEDVLRDVREDEVGGNGRNLVEPRLAKLALHVVLGGEAEASMELEAGFAGLP
jgi:uncharacterized membrane protein YeaQ/YmgE (transglycosylase-associated protein family)